MTGVVYLALVGIGIKETHSGVVVTAGIVSVRYRTKKNAGFVALLRYQTSSGIVNVFRSSSEKTEWGKVRHSSI
jgi:hypothetical protein